jgi:hypothetical protein
MLESIVQVTSSSTSVAQEGVRIQLTPIPFGNEKKGDSNLFNADGSGSISVVVTLTTAADFFTVGRRYLVTFEVL